MNCADPTFTRTNPGQKPPRYAADVDGLGYLIVGGPTEDDCWSLFVDGELLAESYRNFGYAARAARTHLDARREDAAETTVTEFLHPDDGSALSVFTNGYTGLTEVILNDTDGTHRLVLDRDLVQELARALAQVNDGQQQVRGRGAHDSVVC